MEKYQSDSYRDFEGLADSDKVLEICKDETDPAKHIWDVFFDMDAQGAEFIQAVRDIGLNILYEMLDQDDTFIDLNKKMKEQIAWAVFYTVHEMLTVPNWTKSGLEDGICPNCGEADHCYRCPKPENISKEKWQQMSDDERLEVEK